MFSIIIVISFIVFLLFNFFLLRDNNIGSSVKLLSGVDISEPKFAINGERYKIYVTAMEGNFMDENKIMLKNNVVFKSDNFSINTDKVIFDRKKQTAESDSESIFKSKNASISSEGFNIYDKGNKIKFYGNSIVILK